MRALFATAPFAILSASLASNLLAIYVLVFLGDTTLPMFFLSTNVFYIAASILLTLLMASGGGLALAQTIYILSAGYRGRRGQGSARSVFGAGLGVLSAGCPACASTLLPLLGIAGSLAAFPLAGLEIKLIMLAILGDAIWEGSRLIAGICPVADSRLVRVDEGELVFTFNGDTWRQIKPAVLISAAVLAVFLLPKLPPQFRVPFTTGNGTAAAQPNAPVLSTDAASLIAQINPPGGYALPYSYGDIGPALVEAGAIEVARFSQVYVEARVPLSDDQMAILTDGSQQPITITRENAHFLLNLFWALGLTNQNPILDEGPLMENSKGQIETYASTGGWTLGARPVTELYSSTPILSLAPEQQARVEEAAANTYRPCCNNSTAFADCNHGMAMLGLFELMASQGATVDEMFEAAKYFNAFWFPQQTLDLATYFQATTGQSFAGADARTLVSATYSSGQGWSAVRQWLAQNGLREEAPGGGGCGV